MFKNVSCLVYMHDLQISSLWKCGDTEIVVSVIPTKTEGQSMVIHHSEFRILWPHQWLVGEVKLEFYFHTCVVP